MQRTFPSRYVRETHQTHSHQTATSSARRGPTRRVAFDREAMSAHSWSSYRRRKAHSAASARGQNRAYAGNQAGRIDRFP
jgi:hypothetical protein